VLTEIKKDLENCKNELELKSQIIAKEKYKNDQNE